tara:strand:- start:3623 stop:4510 length:888 start_codon:yes stop_codon:yes gene_type:complete
MSVISFDNRDGWIWQNGSFVQWNNAKTHIISQGLHYASSVFEGERAYNGVIFKSQEHTDRLFKSAEILGIEIPYTKDQINSAKEELIKKMNYKNCYVRAIAWHGAKVMGVSTKGNVTHVAIAAWDDWATYFKKEDRLKGLKLITSPWRRPSPETTPWNAKASGLYMICTMSKTYAEKKGYHDSLMLDHRGNVAEATGANIFLIKDNNIHTPIADCFLNGITRQTVISIAKEKNIGVIERYIKPSELSSFSEAFLTGTAAEITSISEIDNVKFSTGHNTLTNKLMDAYSELVGSLD